MSITILPKTNDSFDDSFYIHNAVNFNIKNTYSCLTNSLRRILLSNIPTVSFDDTWNDNEQERNINIISNNSGLHNEFLAHRLSLLPIYRYNDNTREKLKIDTKFNTKKNKREYMFESEDLPLFHLLIDKNKIQTDLDSKNRYGLFEVNTSHIQYSSEYTSEIDCSEYFPPDLFIKESFKENNYTIINMLKSNENLDIYMKPSVGIGKHNARYCCVGTVSYMFEQDESKFDEVFTQSIEYENQERLEKQINQLNEKEIEIKKNSFMVLDKERVFKTDKYNQPNSFNFCVESIGMIPSHQIVYDGLTIFKLKLYDIIHSFNLFVQYNNNVVYNSLPFSSNNVINVIHSIENLYGYKIIVQNENHTLGNVICHYLNVLYSKNYVTNKQIDLTTINTNPTIDINEEDLYTFKVPLLEQCGYKMPHPLKEELEFKLKLRDDISLDILNELYQTYSLELIKLFSISQSDQDKEISVIEKRKIISIYTFIKSILVIIDILNSLLDQWTSETQKMNHMINSPSFSIKDSQNHFLNEKSIVNEDINIDTLDEDN